MNKHLNDAIRLAALERQRWDRIDRELRAGSDPLAMANLVPWRTTGGLLSYNVAIASGTNENADHAFGQYNFPGFAGDTWSTFFSDAYEFYAQGTTDFAASAVLNFWFKIGTTKTASVAVTMPASAATGKRWNVRMFLSLRTAGATGTMLVQIWGFHESLAAPYIFTSNVIAAPATYAINTQNNNALAPGMNWSAANASNNARVDFTYWSKLSGGTG